MLDIMLFIIGRKVTIKGIIMQLKRQENECISMPRQMFEELVINCRQQWKEAWSKEYREMDKDRLVETILKYMKDWMLIRCEGEMVIILPGAGRLTGQYPADYQGGKGE